MDSLGLITDLAWMLLLGAVVTLVFKKLNQPVVLGYIIAGFLASPKFEYLPSITNMANMEFWAEIGIVVLMFCLGLEFSFKKLMNSGSSAMLTALVIISGMTFCGFGVGKLLHFDTVNCIFLGGMISMSSTTIILKALTDLGLRQKKFASLVLAVLIIEDLFAVVMLVLLSSIAIGSVEGKELLYSIAKLGFFLIIWFVVGVYLLPTILGKLRKQLNSESLLIVSMGLCFGMAVFSVSSGFSMELGAFVMGSILAGTIFVERIEKVVEPVKNLFGAVFFISVGMMVDPVIIATYWSEILILAAVVIIGMMIFGTLGMLLAGQTLRVAIESGFTLTQIGEFSFIIASLGMSLGVLNPTLYPIIVAVSVITIFTTPYFIRLSEPAYAYAEKHLPKRLNFLIDRYSSEVREMSDVGKLWKAVIGRYIWRLVLYTVILTAILLLSFHLLYPFMEGALPRWGRTISTILTAGAMLPFLIAMTYSSSSDADKALLRNSNTFNNVPLTVMKVVRYIVAFFFLVYLFSYSYGTVVGWTVGAVLFVVMLVFASRSLKGVYDKMEHKFMDNLNKLDNIKYGRNNSIVDDMHQAYIKVGDYCSFLGYKLQDSGLRSRYGVSISSIRRGEELLPLPSSETRIYPGDMLGIIGTDEQIKKLNDALELEKLKFESMPHDAREPELRHFSLMQDSPIIGKALKDLDLVKNYASMLVKVKREGEGFMTPKSEMVLNAGDIIWVVGDSRRFSAMAGSEERG